MTHKTKSNAPLRVTCESLGGDKLSVRYQITNSSSSTVHIFESSAMPYVLRQGDNTLVLLHGVNPPDPDVDYYGIDIPTTRPLDAGESASYKVSLDPLYLSDHYGQDNDPTELHGSVQVLCKVGWGKTAIGERTSARMSIKELLDWQQLVESEPVTVRFP